MVAMNFTSGVKANDRNKCIEKWNGVWIVTADGEPIFRFDFRENNQDNLGATVERWPDFDSGLTSVIIRGEMKKSPALIKKCSDAQISISFENRTQTSTFILYTLKDNVGWMEIADLPPGFSSPKYRIIKDTKMLSFKSRLKGERLAYDLFDETNKSNNPEISKMFATDQAERKALENVSTENYDSAVDLINHNDVMRIIRLKDLHKNGEINTAVDYAHASLILQHGDSPLDYLLAHHFAVTAIALGHQAARWLSAATLDRYLLSISQPQLYGTQITLGGDNSQGVVDLYKPENLTKKDLDFFYITRDISTPD